MIAWTKAVSNYQKPLGYLRLLRARICYNEYYRYSRKRLIIKRPGYQDKIAQMRNKYEGKRCFVIGNGPSLKKMDLSSLKDEITIGSNAIYKHYDEMGFSTDFLILEDIEQTEIRGPELKNVKGPIKMASLYNAYAIACDKDTLFFNSPRPSCHGYYWAPDLYPQFSRDFASIVHLGSTVTYIGLQLAYHLGCSKVYLIGVDHNYGRLPELFPPGKIMITEENLPLVEECHFSKGYYKVGDQIGVPYSKKQEEAYNLAKQEFEMAGRQILNAGVDSKLPMFPKVDFESLVNT
jgi:Protein of unknown function DUF115